MHGAIVKDWAKPPEYVELENPPAPSSDSLQIKVTAAGFHSVVRARASGKHFSAGELPHIPGTDGVGKTRDGQAVYFSSFNTGGSYCDLVNVPKQAVTPLPTGVDETQVAAFMNPATSSWMALKTRTSNLPANFTILIMGVTSASGAIAVSVARSLGGGKVIGVARNVEKMSRLGLDRTIQLCNPVAETDFSSVGDVDVVLDYLYGPPTEHLLKSPLASSRPVQFVHIGELAGREIRVPGGLIRSKNITIRGSGPGSFSMPEMAGELPKLLEQFTHFKKHPVNVVPLSRVQKSWGEGGGDRTVFVP